MSNILNRYPAWKYILLIAIVVFGLIYAAPNLYPQDPAVQVSGQSVYEVSATQVTQIKQALTQSKVAYKSISMNEGKILVRLTTADSELKAKEVVQIAVGEHYTAAVNLVPSTPKWLAEAGGEPMKLGLDLRGGVHFLLEVDVASVIQKREMSDVRTIATTLREADVRYAGIQPQKPSGLLLKFRDKSTLDKAKNLLRQKFPTYTLNDITRNGVLYLQANLTEQALSELRDSVMSQTIQVLNKRVDALGVGEAVVARQGLNRIAVDLPGVQDTAQASQILGGNATLEAHLVNENADVQNAVQGIVPPGSKLYHMLQGNQPIVLFNKVILTGSAVNNASSGMDQNGQPSVTINATGPEVPAFHRITGDNVGHRMAFVLINVKTTPKKVNGKIVNVSKKEAVVINDATIQSALPGTFVVTGLASPQMAKNLAIQLRSGTTPANLIPLQELLVGPSMGKTNIQHGVVSVVAGFLMIVVFMMLYYRLFGLIANVALFMNLVITIAIMSILHFTLSLAGIAGMVLAVGMAVDANVLIFERIREELRNGNTPQAAIHAGYERAFSTIVDANVTTLIVAVVLFAIASSNIKGFAITLIIGLLTSMLTAIMGTRSLVNLVYGGRIVKKLSIGIKVKK
tara:strand:+ start:2660 stop:4546 length:1887 start_codon:yes stop_codon:yes gene_type:complete